MKLQANKHDKTQIKQMFIKDIWQTTIKDST